MLKTDDLVLVASLCRKRAGVKIDPAKPYPIESRLSPLLRRESAASTEELIGRVKAGDDRTAWLVVEAMAGAETSFFRDKLPFDQFAELLPNLAAERDGEPVRVWSAGCGSGQEAYSLAMLAAASPASVEILGTDISERALRKAQAGLYTQFEIQRGLPARMLVEHFEKSGETWRISDSLRAAVRWRRVNLIGDLTPMPRFDIIFCRNVLRLLDEPFQRRVLESLAVHLEEEGVLVLGLKETAQAGAGFVAIEGRPGLYRRGAARRAA